MILTLLNLVVRLLPALLLVLGLGLIAVRHQRLFLFMFMLLTALESTRDFAPSFKGTFSGISVHPEDLVTVIGSVAALARIGHWRLQATTRVAMLISALLVGLGLIAWVSTFGLQLGTNSWRPQILIIALLFYTTTRPRDWSWHDLQIIFVSSAIVVGLASLAGILLFGFGSNSSTLVVNGVLEDGRPVQASGSLMMLIGLCITVLSVGKWSARRLILALFLATMVLLTENRSVWLATIVGAIIWWFMPRIHFRGTSRGLGGFGRTLVVIPVAAATALVALSVAALGQSASNDSTLLWRIARWANSMSIPRSSLEWLVGSAFGPTPASTPTLFLTSAHSLYVNSIEMTGCIGLVASLILVIATCRAKLPPSIEPVGVVVCFIFLTYGLTYQLPAWAWMFAGLLLASNWSVFKEESVRLQREGTVANSTKDT